MATVTLDLPTELYRRLQDTARRVGQPADAVVIAWIAEQLADPPSERERAIAVLRAAGLVAEPSAAMHANAAQATMSLAQVQAALDRAGGTPLSEVIIAQRGALP